MAIPASYTEKSLAEYMHSKLGKVALVLGLSVGASDAGSYEEAVNDTLLAYGESNIASITGTQSLRKLRTLATFYAWQFVVNNFAALYDYSADGGSYHRSQLFEQAEKALKLAQTDALVYDPSYTVKIRKIDHLHDPYTVRDVEERNL